MLLSERDRLIAQPQIEEPQRYARLLRLIRAAQAARQPAPVAPPPARRLLAARLWLALVRPRARRMSLLKAAGWR